MRDTVRKTLEELSEDYYEAAEVLKSRIADRNKKLREFPASSKRAEAVRAELRVLYRERTDTLESARILEKYYLGREE